MKSRKLKNFLIWPKYQLNHALFTFGIVLLSNGIFAYFTLQYIRNLSVSNYFEDISALKHELMSFVIVIFVAASLVSGIGAIVINIIHTHRVFGSLQAIERFLKEVLAGKNPKPLTVRSKDQSGEIVSLINKIVKRNANSGKEGFTLLELLVVIAIIGILSAIAQTNYKAMVIRAKLSEAKTTLSNIYLAESVYKMEFNTYTTRLDAMGFIVEGKATSTSGFGTDVVPPPNATQGTITCTSTCGVAVGGGPSVCNTPTPWTCEPSARCGMDSVLIAPSTATTNSFLAHTHAHFEGCVNAVDAYTYTIDERKRLLNVVAN